MDADRFDRLTRIVGARLPRRAAWRWIAGIGLGSVLGAAGALPAAAQSADAPCAPGRPKCPSNRKPVSIDGACFCQCRQPAAGPCCPDERADCPIGCVKLGACCPTERTCRRKVGKKIQTTCLPGDQCCEGRKRCSGVCIKQGECCPATERECRVKVGKKKVRKSCVAKDACCPDEKPCAGACIDKKTCCSSTEIACASAPDGCCNSFTAEECTLVDGCCGGIDGGTTPCDGTWCCKDGERCELGVGCVQRCQPPYRDCPDGTCALPGYSCCPAPAETFCLGRQQGDGKCCTANQTCLNAGSASSTCCSTVDNAVCGPDVPYGDYCCPKSSTICCRSASGRARCCDTTVTKCCPKSFPDDPCQLAFRSCPLD